MTLLICIQPIAKDLNQHHKVCDPGNGQIYACIDTWSLAVRVLVYHCLYWYITACVDSRPIDFLHNEILPVLHVMFKSVRYRHHELIENNARACNESYFT